jgi:hypothetical protein
LESTPHILDVEDVISILESSCALWKRLILFFWWIGTPGNGASDSVETSYSRTLDMKELALGRCYRGHFPFIGPRHYKLKV